MFFNSIVPTPEGTLLPQQILELATIPLERAKKSGDHDIVPTFCHHVGAILSQLQGTTKTSATSTGPEEQIQHNPVAEVCFHLGKLMDDREYHEQAKAFYNKALELDSGILASSPLKMVSQPRILVQSNRHGEWSTGMLISCCGEGLRVDDHHRSQLGHQGAVIIPFTVGQEQEYITQYVSFHQDDATSDGECSCVLTGDHSALSCIFQNAGKQVDIPLEPEVANLSPARANLLRMATGKLVLFKYNPELGTALREAYVALSCTVDLCCGSIRCYMGNDYVTSATHAFTWTLDSTWRRSITEPFVVILKDKRVRSLRGHAGTGDAGIAKGVQYTLCCGAAR